ncbi:MAG: hypothetical protein EA351_14085, partial [Gemmatimonadales bacterium]
MIRFGILGALELRDGEGIEVRSVMAQPRRTALLACLALAGVSGFVRRDLLMGRLWPDSPQDRARHSLNQAVYGLRRSLGLRTIVSRGDEDLGLDSARIQCDAATFETALREGRREEAIALCRGDLLPGFHLSGAPVFEQWLETNRSRLRQAAVSAAWDLVDEAERAGRMADAVSKARRATALSGEDELSVQRLLRLLARGGDRAAAVRTYEAFARRVRADPGVEPSPETKALIAEIRGPRPDSATASSSPPSSPAPAAALPRQGLPLVGREDELGRLEGLLANPHSRLVTLTGPGGVGKTRLAVELALRNRAACPEGTWFVPLAGVTSADLVPAAVAQALGLAPGEGDSGVAVGRYLSHRSGLLVLDNLEHLLDAVGFIAELLDRAPDLRIVVTSRESLRLHTEWVLPVEGLEIPSDASDDPDGCGSVRLFTEAARRGKGVFRIDEGNRRSVGRICRLVEGIPLAIELAATWTRAMSLDEIGRELEKSRGFLARDFRDGPERHRSLEAAFEHSWSLLDEGLRAVLAGLSVFRGSFDRDAAGEVTGAGLADLAALVEKSLVRRLPGGRYELLEVIREFAGEKLARDSGAEADVLVRHSLYFTDFLARLRPALAGPEKDDALARVGTEMDNLRAAWGTATGRGIQSALGSAADALFTVYDCRGWHGEAEVAFRKAVEGLSRVPGSNGDDGSRASVEGILLARRGAALHRLGRSAEGRGYLQRALER